MEKLIGQDIDVLYKTNKSPIISPTKSISFPNKVVADFKKGEVIKVTNQNNQLYWVLGGVALVTVIGGIIYYYGKSKKENEDSFAAHKNEIDKLKSDFHSFFEEKETMKNAKPVRIIRKKKINLNPYFNL